MAPFVRPRSIVRDVWGDADTVLFIFAGSAAEFALSRAVDWLFFTGALPGDPVGRLFSTARFAQEIVFDSEEHAERTLSRVRSIHEAVERERGQQIPAWAHRDVLYMLIDYSERAYALLRRPLAPAEQRELYDMFRRVGIALAIPELPATYDEWRTDRQRHLERDLARSAYTEQLYAQYRRHLGAWRYRVLRWVQTGLVPATVGELLGVTRSRWFGWVIRAYRAGGRVGLRPVVHRVFIPAAYRRDVKTLDYRGTGLGDREMASPSHPSHRVGDPAARRRAVNGAGTRDVRSIAEGAVAAHEEVLRIRPAIPVTPPEADAAG